MATDRQRSTLCCTAMHGLQVVNALYAWKNYSSPTDCLTLCMACSSSYTFPVQVPTFDRRTFWACSSCRTGCFVLVAKPVNGQKWMKWNLESGACNPAVPRMSPWFVVNSVYLLKPKQKMPQLFDRSILDPKRLAETKTWNNHVSSCGIWYLFCCHHFFFAYVRLYFQAMQCWVLARPNEQFLVVVLLQDESHTIASWNSSIVPQDACRLAKTMPPGNAVRLWVAGGVGCCLRSWQKQIPYGSLCFHSCVCVLIWVHHPQARFAECFGAFRSRLYNLA